MLSDFITIVAYIWAYLKGYIIVAFILSKLCYALYLKFTGYDKWYLGLIPFGHVYYKHELAGVSYIALSFQIVAVTLFCTTYSLIFFIIALALCTYTNFCFARIYVDQYSALLYSLVPFGKYFIMVREVIINARDASR